MFGFGDVILEYALCSDDDGDKGSEGDASIIVFFAFVPEFFCHFWIELWDSCVLLADGV